MVSYAQNETNHWYFGTNSGVDFSSGLPIAVLGQAGNTEGTACVSDPTTGALLFYCDGKTVWDATHIPMPNGTGLTGGYSSTMSSLIVPLPGSSTIYYLFTTDEYQNNGTGGFCYNIIDMAANGGLGDVISKNNLLFSPCSEINHAVKHANCFDYWVISSDALGNSYKAYLLTASGLITTPVISSIGHSFLSPGWSTGKFSPNGKKFAMTHGRQETGSENYIQLFDFDILTGTLSNVLELNHWEHWYGLSFSPDNSKLYSAGNTMAAHIYQWDLSSGDNTTIKASKTSIGWNMNFSQLQIGTDHKIYISRQLFKFISVINEPNLTGMACDFVINAIPLIKDCQLGLPPSPENYFNESPVGMDIFEFLDTTIFYGMSSTILMPGTGNISWSPGTFLSCTNCPNPTITPEEDIEYIVSDDLNGYGCPINRRIRIKVEYKPQIPNIFTPNSDGQNETFFINGLPPDSDLQIFNRWGNLLFQSADYKNDWKTEVDGVYYYLLKVRDQEYKGFVQVLTK
jgi:gliding motility-associated-like protein